MSSADSVDMENSSEIVWFVLAMYDDTGNLAYPYFFLTMLCYISVIFSNTALVLIIYMDRNLHEPMYLFLCSLLVNDIYGSTTLLPCLMRQILSKTHEISVSFCFIQIFTIHTYVAAEFGTLTIMAYDRYVCICKPLHYNRIISKRRVQIVIPIIWTVSFVEVGVLLSFTIRSKLCGSVINKVHCDNHLVVELSCSPDRTLSYIYDVFFGLIVTVATPLCFISFSYVKILAVCLKASKETKVKAFNTCTPHVVSLLSFVFACFYNLISQRFDMSFAPFELRVFMSTYGLIVQPLLNPVIYGLVLSNIRHALKLFVRSRILQLDHTVKVFDLHS